MSAMEVFTFDKGLNTKKSSLTLEDGEHQTASAFEFDVTGDLSVRTPKEKVSSTAIGTIHTLHRYKNYILVGDANAARYKWDLDGYCDLYVPPNEDFTSLGSLNSSTAWQYADAEDFVFIVNGVDSKAFCNSTLYDWIVENPTKAPVGTAGDSGNPNDTYTLYYSYYILWPNGRTYETGLSPSGSVTVSSKKIEWSQIGICPYSGTDVEIHRKLYRTSDTLTDIYYVATLNNNTATTYSDNNADATLEANAIETTEGMSPPPAQMVDIEYYLGRIFGIKGSYLYPSEPYLPFTFDLSNELQVTPASVDLVCVIAWGDQLYLASQSKWYRLQGSSASTWSIKNTFAETGVLNRRTAIPTRFGIMSQWYDGIYLFDGSVSKSVTKDHISTSTFTGLTYPKSAYSEFDGQVYRFYYPSSSTTTLDTCLCIDMTDYPRMKFWNEDFIATAFEHHFQTGINYYGYDGYHYKDGSTETITATLKTGDRGWKDITHQKQLEYLYYDINTNSKDVTVTFYADGTAQSPTITLNTSTRTRARVKLPAFEGYRFAIYLTCADASGLHIYSPWIVSADIFGD